MEFARASGILGHETHDVLLPLIMEEQPIFGPDTVPKQICYDVGNPYDVDNILGFPQVGVEGGAAFPPAPPFSAQEDFQLMF
jgi:hypothetical protein